MGIWNRISSKADSIKQNAPDLNSVKDLCRASYDQTRAAAKKAHDAAAEKLSPNLPDKETRSKIVADLAINAASFAFRELVPGGSAVYKIVSQSQSLSSNKTSMEQTEELKKLKDKVSRLEKEISDHEKSVEQAEMSQPTTKLQSKI